MSPIVGLAHYLLVRGGVGRALVALEAGVVVAVLGGGARVLVAGGELPATTLYVVASCDVGLHRLHVGVPVVSRFILGLDIPSSIRELLQILAAVRELLGRGARVAHLLALHGLEGLVGERLHVALRRRELTTLSLAGGRLGRVEVAQALLAQAVHVRADLLLAGEVLRLLPHAAQHVLVADEGHVPLRHAGGGAAPLLARAAR